MQLGTPGNSCTSVTLRALQNVALGIFDVHDRPRGAESEPISELRMPRAAASGSRKPGSSLIREI